MEGNKVLVPLTPEDAKVVLADFEKFKDERGIALNARPFIEDGKIEVEARFFKVVDVAAIAPKEEGPETDGKEKESVA